MNEEPDLSISTQTQIRACQSPRRFRATAARTGSATRSLPVATCKVRLSHMALSPWSSRRHKRHWSGCLSTEIRLSMEIMLDERKSTFFRPFFAWCAGLLHISRYPPDDHFPWKIDRSVTLYTRSYATKGGKTGSHCRQEHHAIFVLYLYPVDLALSSTCPGCTYTWRCAITLAACRSYDVAQIFFEREHYSRPGRYDQADSMAPTTLHNSPHTFIFDLDLVPEHRLSGYPEPKIHPSVRIMVRSLRRSP